VSRKVEAGSRKKKEKKINIALRREA